MGIKWHAEKLPYSTSAKGLVHYSLIQDSFVAQSEQLLSCGLSPANGVDGTAQLGRAAIVEDITQVKGHGGAK